MESVMKIIKSTFYIIYFIFAFPLFAEKDISIITNPSGAGVYYDGKKLGITPLTFSKESSELLLFKNPGKVYDFILYKDFFEGEIITVTYERNKNNQYKIDLLYLKRLPLYDGIFQEGYTLNFFELLLNSNTESLAALRNEIYAKHGGKLDPEFKDTLGKKSWYKENPYFSQDFFSDTDLINLELIAKLEFESDENLFFKKTVTNIAEYTGIQNSILFTVDGQATITNYDLTADTNEPVIESVQWRIIDNEVYLWNIELEKLYYAILNHDNAEIEEFNDISYKYWMPDEY